MMINKDSLKARANNFNAELDVPHNSIYERFFFDAFLSRMAVSPYKDKLVLKGGLYLSSLLGIDLRHTVDVDFYLKNLAVERETIIKIIIEILSIDIHDGIVFKYVKATKIRPEDEYGGFQIVVLAKLGKVRYEFGIDIATGDPIIPSEHNYDYKCLLTGETLQLKAYSLESVVSEKIETVFAKKVSNSRSKDFYDLYILRKTQIEMIDINVLRKAFKETCKYRNLIIDKSEALQRLEDIEASETILLRWKVFARKNKYASDIDFKDVMKTIRQWTNDIFDE